MQRKKRADGADTSDSKKASAKKVGQKPGQSRQRSKSGRQLDKKKTRRKNRARQAKDSKKEEDEEESEGTFYSTDSTTGVVEESHMSRQGKHRTNRAVCRRRDSPID